MSDAIIVALITSSFGALALVITGIIVDHRSRSRDAVKNEKIDHILIQTDGNYSAILERFDRAEEMLRQMVAERAEEGLPPTQATSTPEVVRV